MSEQIRLFITSDGDMESSRGAMLSADRLYRYKLWRIWRNDLPKVLFIMHNPSTADVYVDDPTIRRCIGFAQAWGYGGFYVGNLSPFRATLPQFLVNDPDPKGSREMQKRANEEMAKLCDKVIIAHGIPHSTLLSIDLDVKKCYHLGLTKDGFPRHPLYLPRNTKPIPF